MQNLSEIWVTSSTTPVPHGCRPGGRRPGGRRPGLLVPAPQRPAQSQSAVDAAVDRATTQTFAATMRASRRSSSAPDAAGAHGSTAICCGATRRAQPATARVRIRRTRSAGAHNSTASCCGATRRARSRIQPDAPRRSERWPARRRIAGERRESVRRDAGSRAALRVCLRCAPDAKRGHGFWSVVGQSTVPVPKGLV